MNVFTYAAIEEQKFEAMASECGYKRISTFYSDLSIAEFMQMFANDANAIRDTYNRVMKSWMSDYKMITEFILSLNWKSWEHSEENEEIAELYSDLFYEARDAFYDHYEGNSEATTYFFQTTD